MNKREEIKEAKNDQNSKANLTLFWVIAFFVSYVGLIPLYIYYRIKKDELNANVLLKVTLAYTIVIAACFSLIYVVGDKIGNWIGMPQQPSDIEKHVEGVRQGMQQGVQEGVGGMGQAVGGAKGISEVGVGGVKAIGDVSAAKKKKDRASATEKQNKHRRGNRLCSSAGQLESPVKVFIARLGSFVR